MLAESFIAASLATSNKANIPSTLKDVGILVHEFQPQSILRHGFKQSSTKVNCVAISDTHIFAAQADRAVVLVYNREKGNQEATVAFPERISSLDFVGESSGFLILGTEGGRLNIWDVASGRQAVSTASHLQPVSCLSILPGGNFVLSGSPDSNVHIWSLPRLLSFSQSQSLSSHETPYNAQLRTFSHHRSGITALACGHSRFLLNFAVSASTDGTCYVWSTTDCQLLRTILLPVAPLSLAIDPADRAAYYGLEDGSIQCFDFYNGCRDGQSLHTANSSNPVQLRLEDSWSPASADIGSAQCLTLSYDGTILLSGHSNGHIVSWDIVKRRVHKIVTDVGNSVTHVAFQRPEGLPRKHPRIKVPTIVKPNLNLSSSTSGMPAGYSLQVQIATTGLLTPPEDTDFHNILTQPQFPKFLVDEAIADLTSLTLPEQTLHTQTYDIAFEVDPGDPGQSTSVAKMQSRITLLEENLAIYVSAAERSRARRLDRMERRERYSKRKREVYLEAANNGQNGDVAMQEWEDKEREVDEESDRVELAEEVYADV